MRIFLCKGGSKMIFKKLIFWLRLKRVKYLVFWDHFIRMYRSITIAEIENRDTGESVPLAEAVVLRKKFLKRRKRK